MPILGIGVDLVSLARVRALVHRRTATRLARRILSPAERAEWDARRTVWTEESELRFLAVRWAAKEATYKALFQTYKSLSWKHIIVSKEAGSPKPSLSLSRVPTPLPPRTEPPTLHLSVSHDADLVIAYVVAEC